MNILDRKWFGALVMVILIIAGTFLGCRLTIHSFYSDLEQIFYHGQDGDGICIENDLSSRAEDAVNLTTIAGKYSDIDVKLTADVKQCAAQLTSAAEINEKKEADDRLTAAFSALYEELEGCGLSEKDEKYRSRLYADFRSRAEIISHDPYNAAAAEYNSKIDSFPANLINRLSGGSEAVLFY